MARRRLSVIVASFLIAGAGCGSSPGPKPGEGGPALALRRGSAWSTFTVKPPHIVGPTASLVLKNGKLSGSLGGDALNVKIVADGADGFSQEGPVSLTIRDAQAAVDVSGMWNGARVHLVVSETSLRGSVPTRGGMHALSQVTCEYVLDQVERDGTRTGVSICGGMPEPTRLEVPAALQGWFSRAELLVLVVALLSEPPMVASERIG